MSSCDENIFSTTLKSGLTIGHVLPVSSSSEDVSTSATTIERNIFVIFFCTSSLISAKGSSISLVVEPAPLEI